MRNAAFALSERDHKRMVGLHPDLVRVVLTCAGFTQTPFMVIEGMRTLARQKVLLAEGASWTLDGRHLTGHAIDLAPLDGKQPSWAWPMYYKLAADMKSAAKFEKVAIDWGGDWLRKKDGPHWELNWRKYPKGK